MHIFSLKLEIGKLKQNCLIERFLRIESYQRERFEYSNTPKFWIYHLESTIKKTYGQTAELFTNPIPSFLLCNLLMISNWCLSFCITLLLLYFWVKERNMNSKKRWYHIVLSSLHPHVISQFSMSIETLFLVSFYGRKGSTRNNF